MEDGIKARLVDMGGQLVTEEMEEGCISYVKIVPKVSCDACA
jgi:hypothetical protein